jgi:hypothetical protein
MHGSSTTINSTSASLAALSLDGRGVAHYGDCFLVLKDSMIAHRLSVFEENTVVFMEHHAVGLTEDLPKGYRAPWPQRGRLAVAKLATQFTDQTGPGDYAGLLLRNAPTADADDFIEVHIYGPLSIHAVESVHFRHGVTGGVRVKALRERLKALGIPLSKH